MSQNRVKPGLNHTFQNQSNDGEVLLAHTAMAHTTTNFLDANIAGLKEHKAGIFETNRKKIGLLHERLMKAKSVQLAKAGTQLQKHLGHKMKETYLRQSKMTTNHSQHFSDINSLNQAMLEVIDSTCNFKVNLSETLQMVIECYCSVFLQQYQTFHGMQKEKDERIEAELQTLRLKQSEVDKIKEKLGKKQEFC